MKACFLSNFLEKCSKSKNSPGGGDWEKYIHKYHQTDWVQPPVWTFFGIALSGKAFIFQTICSLDNTLNRPVHKKTLGKCPAYLFYTAYLLKHLQNWNISCLNLARYDKTALLIITKRHSEHGTRNLLHRLN